jgi:glucosamine-6-phosphate deaminase
MEVIIRPTAASAAALTANLIARALHGQPKLVLGLATGRTMERVYAELARRHREQALDFSLCRTFNLDEYVGLAPEHPDSYRQYMNRLLFRQVNIDLRNTHVLNGIAPDLAAECAQYERQIVECGGIDLQLLGIGSDGHIGFNEPLSSLQSRTREKALTPATRAQNAVLFGGDMGRVPARALTMGVGTIQESRRCLLLVTGREKAAILARAVEGPITAMVTASALQLHPRCTVIVDEEAAAELQGSEYYRWVFATEPEWAEFR